MTISQFPFLNSISIFISQFHTSKGICLGSMGPSLLDLAVVAGVDVVTISTAFIAKNAGAIIGSLVGGILLDRYSRPIIMGVSMGLLGTCFAFIPWCNTYPMMAFLLVLFGVMYGCQSTGIYCCDFDYIYVY